MDKKDITIQQLLEHGVAVLESEHIQNPFLDTQLLLGYSLNVDKVYIYTHRDEVVDKEYVENFLDLLDKRRKGYPLQYILGTQEFMGLSFEVGEGVLVPRPDTEVLVESIIEIAKTEDFIDRDQLRILDIGTGSGAITLSLAYYIRNSKVFSVDISDKALEIAKKNSERLGLDHKVTFLKGDLFNPIKRLDGEMKFDIIVSNPPYIPSGEIDSLQKEVAKYEPRLALDGGIDGLDFYRKIVCKSPLFLDNKGLLAFEIGYNQGNSLKNLLHENKGFKNIIIRKDLAGHDRVVFASWEGS